MGGSKLKNIIGVRFKKLGKIYFFNPKNLKVHKGDKVIVETAQGEEFGEVVIPNRFVDDEKIIADLFELSGGKIQLDNENYSIADVKSAASKRRLKTIKAQRRK